MADLRNTSAEPSDAAKISRALIRLLRQTAGRGPTRAQTTIASNLVIVMLSDSLTEGERTLVANGFEHEVRNVRQAYQAVMQDEASAAIEEVLGRRVIGFMSTNHFDPDLGAEIFVLEPNGEGGTDVQEAAEPS